MALNGKIAIMTGAAQGIGKAMTEMLLQNGAKVALLDVNETEGKKLMEALKREYGLERTLFHICDVESEEQIKAAFQKTAETFGGIDILCNNAGIANETAWEKTVSINLVGVIRGTYLALEHMNKLTGGRGGIIVNTASITGKAHHAASTASDYGIRVNARCVQTNLLSIIPSRPGPYSHLADAAQQLVEKFGILT
ncbi:15-hydroxyprostaglandin dehydrogenase [NAD(+)]-like [Micropterus dolomieu]|uniref:15-hydroxyprostaglandin dehydrogenase [NAD(+)]-like n=1 Tax=Micropterus dolomieu TaxID=147949 RepID=UPI001E8EC41B|nr:15-hydroxyprostaglandin dehydrogenase [NAD(+)]-like [Micropterus dolomieu]